MADVKIKVAIADDHVLFRKGLAAILEQYEGIVMTAEAANGQLLLEQLDQERADVVLLDLQMPVMDGIQTVRHLKNSFPEIRILIVSMHDEEDLILNLLDEGIHGYLLKNTAPDEVYHAIQEVVTSGFYTSEYVAGILNRASNY